MNYKVIHKVIAALVFLITFIQFLLTVQPSVSFWDCGEFIASSYSLQVPHPPGAPLFLILGRLFSMIPFGANIAFRVNMISVIASAFSTLFLYLIIVKLIENYRGKESVNLLEVITTYISAAIGALAFSFSDTFWFNGVEAEVYASSTFIFSFIIWLIMLWNERADDKNNEKYLFMIAYLVGLSTGVHLMSVLAIVPVVMVIVFRKYVQDDEACKKTGYIFLGHSVIILLVATALWAGQKSSSVPTPEEYKAFDSKFLWIMIGISAVYMAAFWRKIFNRNSFYIPLIVGGIALMVAYPGVVKLLTEGVRYIGGDDIAIDVTVIIAVFAILGYAIYWSVANKKATLNLVFVSLLFVILGFTSYSMVIIRANKHTPMDENQPDDFSELVSYLNREQYGDFPTWKRRFAAEPSQGGVYTNYSSDLDFLLKYQMDHMFNRYLFWNFIGRQGWVQDDGVKWGQLYGIPFLIGLFGIYFHFKKNWKMATVFLIMFIFQGYLTAFYQNQQEPQPRERDYFYVGAFFVYSIWIALGIKGIIELIKDYLKKSSVTTITSYAILGIGIIFIPVNMARTNWFTHDRSKNWIPWDFAYNLLQSCAPDAILFTNGDNDTFPLWYLQDVEGVRRDVRIANLSLINTPWYIKQLKNEEPYGTPKVPINYTDAMIDNLQPVRWNPQNVSIPVPPEILQKYTVIDTSIENPVPKSFVEKYGVLDSTIIKTGKLTWRMNNTITYGDIKAVRVQDLMVKDIVEASKWQRPIYFAATCSEDSKIGLQDYLIAEGLASRLIPVKRKANMEFVNENIMRHNLFDENPGFSKTYKPGFKLRGLDDKSIFFDENHDRMAQNYRSSFLRLALFYLYNDMNKEMCINTLNKMDQTIPSDVIYMPIYMDFELSNTYWVAGAKDKYLQLARKLEKEAQDRLDTNPNDVEGYYNPYRILAQIYENLQEYNKAVDLFTKLQKLYPNDRGVQNELLKYKRLLSKQDTISKK
jgi:hypothetical protein